MGIIKEKRKSCKMCGKMLPEQEMFGKIEDADKIYYACCQICYELLTGKPVSGNSEIKFK